MCRCVYVSEFDAFSLTFSLCLLCVCACSVRVFACVMCGTIFLAYARLLASFLPVLSPRLLTSLPHLFSRSLCRAPFPLFIWLSIPRRAAARRTRWMQ